MASLSNEIKRTICAVVGSTQARVVNCSDHVTNITGRAKFTPLLTSLDIWYDMTQRVEKVHTNRCYLFVVHIPLQCKEHECWFLVGENQLCEPVTVWTNWENQVQNVWIKCSTKLKWDSKVIQVVRTTKIKSVYIFGGKVNS